MSKGGKRRPGRWMSVGSPFWKSCRLPGGTHLTLKNQFSLRSSFHKIAFQESWKKFGIVCRIVDTHMTQSLQRKVNAFQLRGLRKILGLTTTYINRQYTNEFVIQKANDELGHQPGAPLRIKLFSDLLIDRRIKLAGHILRCEDNDPLRRVSYEPNSADTFNVGKRRVGGPRQQWTQYANKYAWENVLRKGRYENSANQNQELLISARNRHF